MEKEFSKLRLWRDTTISYLAGIAGALVIVFSTEGVNLQPKVFWAYILPMYLFTLVVLFIITKIFRNK